MVATSALSGLFNYLVIKTMLANEDLYRLNSYKFMIALGISGLIQVFAHFVTGILTMARLTGPLLLNQLLGALIAPAYIFYSTLTVVLSLDRFLITFSPPAEYWLFSPFAMKLWLAGCAVVSLAFCAALATPSAAVLYAWPRLSWAYDGRRSLSWLVQLAEEYIEVGGIFIAAILYFLIFVLIGHKRSVGAISKVQMRNRFDLRILVQSFTIAAYCMFATVLWHNYTMFLPDSILGYAVLNFLWIGNSAVNPLIYVFMNGTLRRKFVTNMALTQTNSSRLRKETHTITRTFVARLGAIDAQSATFANLKRVQEHQTHAHSKMAWAQSNSKRSNFRF